MRSSTVASTEKSKEALDAKKSSPRKRADVSKGTSATKDKEPTSKKLKNDDKATTTDLVEKSETQPEEKEEANADSDVQGSKDATEKIEKTEDTTVEKEDTKEEKKVEVEADTKQ
jgi:hypothetical protein